MRSILWLAGACALLVLASAPSGCGGSSSRKPQPRPEAEASGVNTPYLEVERTGGFVGWNQRMRVSADGHWTIESRVDQHALGSGAFDATTMTGLRDALAAVPKSAHGSFSAKGADFVDYRVTLINGIEKQELVSGPWLSGRGGIPAEWEPALDILEEPFATIPPGR